MQKTAAAVEAPMVRVVGVGELESGRGFYLVPSESDPTRYYVVEQWPSRLVCHCRDAFFRKRTCKHMRAAIEHKAALQLAEAERSERAEQAEQAEDRASRGTVAPISAEHRTPNMPTAAPVKKTPAHGRYFGARSQEPFSFMR